MMSQGNSRAIGVAVPQQQISGGGVGSPTTLKHCMPLQMYGIQYYDEQGKEHTQAVVKMGDSWYLAPNGEQWTSQLRPLGDSSWLSKQLNATVSPKVPQADTVDIFAAAEL